ncbi:MAG: ABC transporter permease [Planctomycetes bacterium]|jgi:predicted permease|nr:ABC transporter permease [Planctomycetota bacterium]
MTAWWQDLRYGVRVLVKSPGFTAVAVLTLALGIGANTAIFTLIETLLWKSLPVKDPQQLAVVAIMDSSHNRYSSFSYVTYRQWCEDSQSFSGLLAASSMDRYSMSADWAQGGEPGRVGVQAVSGNFFDVLGAPVLLGRALTPEDDRRGVAEAVAVISYGFWQRRFGLEPAIVGRTIRLENTAVTIVGVTPRGFTGFIVGSYPDLWLPLQATPLVNRSVQEQDFDNPTSQWLRIMGRLRPGVGAEQARAELDVGFQRWLSDLNARFARRGSEKQKQDVPKVRIALAAGGAGYSDMGWGLQRPLLILMAMVGLVLLVACANLAGLLLARGAARRREFGVRAALGASRWALIRQLATESLLLAALGGALGLLVARWGAPLLAHYTIPRFGAAVRLDLALDLRILVFTFFASAWAGMLFGLLPAWQGSRLNLTTTLKDRTGPGDGAPRHFWNKALVVSQIAVSCCLLIGAGLFVRTVQKLKSLDTGFDREHLLAFELDWGKGYDEARRGSVYQEVLRRVEGLSSVRSVGCASIQPVSGSEWGWGPNRVVRIGRDFGAEEGLEVRGTGVTVRYFETMGIPVLRGRSFGPQDEAAASVGQSGQAARPVILDETNARTLFGREDPVGQLLQAGESGPFLEVIGVVKDVIYKRLRGGPRASVYSLVGTQGRVLPYLYVRTLGNPLTVADGIRQIVRELDPSVEVTGLQTMHAMLDDHLFRERSLSSLAGSFSLLALVLACLGLYGILSYGVVRRTPEIGVRMALGARRRDVVALVIRQGLKLVLLGLAIGVGAALAVTRLVASLLYGVTATDPLTFGGVSLLLLGVSLLACWLPARRAAKIDPMRALRCE